MSDRNSTGGAADTENGAGSRYNSQKYTRTGSRYTSADYNRMGSRYGQDTDKKTGQPDEKAAKKKVKEKRTWHMPAWQLPNLREWTQAHISFSLPAVDRRMVILAAAALLIIAYGIGAYHYSGHFYPGTVVLGMDCSGMTADEVRSEIEESVDGYRLSITERGGDVSLIYASQIDLAYVDDQTLEQKLKGQKALLWLFNRNASSEREIPVQTAFSQEKAEQVLEELPFLDEDSMSAPQDAYLTVDGAYLTIVPEKMGTTVDTELAGHVILNALQEGRSSLSLEDEGCYIDPQVYADDEALNTEMNAKNAILGADFTLELGSRSREIGPEEILAFAELQSDGSYQISEGSVWDYVSQLAEETDTYGKEHVFQTTLGTTEYLYDGDYGWELDQDETAQTILNAIADKAQGTIDPIYTHTAMSREENDIGDTYVEICIAKQEMWLYVDGVLTVDTPVVTGNVSKDYDTPSGGVWAIDGKFTNYTLVGQGYSTPVEYWMPFNGGVGIHDLQSRAYFGGTIYLTNGSHGCVNTPLAAVTEIYENVEVGTPVIVYDGE